MTAERTPLAVLIGAAGEAPGILSPTQTTVQNVPTAHWWAQKKRKRTVACGKCDACCRDDCGRCLNCCDKPKFGGPGIRKQSCLERKCKFPTAATSDGLPAVGTLRPVSMSENAAGAALMAGGAPAAAAAGAQNPNMPPQEWNEFWSAVECCMRLAGPGAVNATDYAKRARTARCGSCVGCVRGDCGRCKNCLDKPKFGGRGIKKQACLARTCCNPIAEGDDDDAGVRTEGFLSAEPSPVVRPTPGPPVPALDLLSAAGACASEGMISETRKRLEQYRYEADADDAEEGGRTSRLGYSTADDDEVGDDSPQVATRDAGAHVGHAPRAPPCRDTLGAAEALVLASTRHILTVVSDQLDAQAARTNILVADAADAAPACALVAIAERTNSTAALTPIELDAVAVGGNPLFSFGPTAAPSLLDPATARADDDST